MRFHLLLDGLLLANELHGVLLIVLLLPEFLPGAPRLDIEGLHDLASHDTVDAAPGLLQLLVRVAIICDVDLAGAAR